MNANDTKFSQLNDAMLDSAHGGGDGNYTPICKVAEVNVATALCDAATEPVLTSALCDAGEPTVAYIPNIKV